MTLVLLFPMSFLSDLIGDVCAGRHVRLIKSNELPGCFVSCDDNFPASLAREIDCISNKRAPDLAVQFCIF